MSRESTEPTSEKRELRRRIIALRDGLSEEERAERSAEICRRVAESAEFREAECVLLFASFGSEADTSPLLRAALEHGKRLILPRVNPETRALELREVRSLEDDLTAGMWGIPEPDPRRCPEVGRDEIDFALIPGVAFDRERNRMGYGGGYYDRLQSELRPDAGRIAIAFGLQLIGRVPVGPHDLPVSVLITESQRLG